MIVIYDQPRKVKLVDLFPDSNRKYYIQTFEYGNFDNSVTALIYETSIMINDYSFNSKFVDNGKYKACLSTTYIPIEEVKELNGNFAKSRHKFIGCDGNNLQIKKLEDITEMEIEINGEWIRD